MDSKTDLKMCSKESKNTNTALIEIKCNDGKILIIPYFLIKKFKLLTTILNGCKQNFIELDKSSDFISRNLYKISKPGVKIDDNELKYLGYEDNTLLNDELIHMFKTILYAVKFYEGFGGDLTTEIEGSMIAYCNQIYYNDDVEKVSLNEFKTNPHIYNRYKVAGEGYWAAYNEYKRLIEANDIHSDITKLFKKYFIIIR
jgi:hypothetical protein